MRFEETDLPGVWLIEPAPIHDHRGFFARTFCAQTFRDRGLEVDFVQHSTSYTSRAGTVRGLHFQLPPHSETKVVSCFNGALWDVVLDLRADSPTYGRWQAFDLTAENRCRVYIPAGCAHGFQTLRADVEAAYLISNWHEPSAAAGIRFDDPDLGITWPLPPVAVSDKDKSWPLLSELGH